MITVEHLTKCYGDFVAVDDLSFEIGEGHVYGFLGPNGAGKSTTMNIMTGCLSATAGHVRIDGHDIFDEPNQAKALIGYLPEQPPLYMNETPAEYLRFVGEAKGLRGEELTRQIEAVMEQTKIQDMRNRCINALSKGYKQRVGFAQALLGNPPVLILDEPTVGLDPTQLIEVRNLILDLKHDHTIILSSHILSEISAICDRVVIISRGEIQAIDTIENLEKNATTSTILQLKVKGSSSTVSRIAGQVDGVLSVSNIKFVQTGVYSYDITIRDNSIRNSLLSALLQNGLDVVEIGEEKKSLEQVFVNLVNQPNRKKKSIQDLLAELEEDDGKIVAEDETPDTDLDDAENEEE